MLKKTTHLFWFVLILSLAFTNITCVSQNSNKAGLTRTTKKYIAFTADTEAYFCPPSFEHWQGIYTMDIVRVCEKENVPFTWLVVCDRERQPREFREIDAMMKTVWPTRKGIDEFGIHVHFNYYINDTPGDEVWKQSARRLTFAKVALAYRDELGMPAPLSFRYGGGDMRARFYLDDDLELLHSAGVRNYLLRHKHNLTDFQGLTESEIKHLGNNVWQVRDMKDITIFRGPGSNMELPTNEMLRRIDHGLSNADYIIITSHDYDAAVPANLSAAVRHLHSKYNCEITTIARIGELIRAGKLNNEFPDNLTSRFSWF
ncbi:MAG: hypothetical protein ACYS1A_04065 [Planctomycetota bacterium]|jgi:hypothetical protein